MLEVEVRPDWSDISLARPWRDAIRANPLVPYDQLDTNPRHFRRGFLAYTDGLMESGWALGGHSIASLHPPIPWTHSDHSFEFHLQAWEPLTYLLQAYEDTRRETYFRASLAFALDWIETYQTKLTRLPFVDALIFAEAHKETKAWYDMGVGQRTYRLAYLIDVAARSENVSDKILFDLLQALLFHHQLLGRDSFFVGHTNHGLYQALGQLAACRRFASIPALSRFRSVAEQRLSTMIKRSFFDSGAHREHSPGYHSMILGSLLGARRSGLLKADLAALLDQAEEILAWMVMPDCSLAPIGDTDPTLPLGPEGVAHLKNEHLRHVLTDGKSGIPPLSGLRLILDAGYALVRDHRHGSFLAQMAGFHSRTHKHADHLTFVWCEGKKRVFIDPGRYGYVGRTEVGSDLHKRGFWYADPRRIYAERTRAHNCVEVDGRDYERTGRYGQPFGSGLIGAWQHEGGLVAILSEARYFRTIRHIRALILAPGQFLLVLDWLRDASEASHNWRQWFQIGSDWRVDRYQTGFSAFEDGGMNLRIASIPDDLHASAPMSGEVDPELTGWCSDRANSLIPSTAVYFEKTNCAMVVFATIAVISKKFELDRKRSAINASLTRGQVKWEDDRGTQHLSFSRQNNQIQLSHEARVV